MASEASRLRKNALQRERYHAGLTPKYVLSEEHKERKRRRSRELYAQESREQRVRRQSKALKRYAAGTGPILEAKARPCMDCGGSFPPVVMDFDHVRGVKLFPVGQGRKRSMAVVQAEIAKCDVVCSNCHRIRTHARRMEKSRCQ